MCRLFFAFHNNTKIDDKIKEFLGQSHHSEKNTPNINNPRDVKTHLDGFGFAWYNNSKAWETYKNPQDYREDSNIEKIIESMPKNIVLGHIRHSHYGENKMENTHPFLFENKVFMQNGNIENFQKHRNVLLSHISSELLGNIQGETDTEVLFYLYLSCIHYIENMRFYKTQKNATRKKGVTSTKIIRGFTKKQIKTYEELIKSVQLSKDQNYAKYINAFRLLVAIFKDNKIELSANIIYADDDVVIVTRYLYYNKSMYNSRQCPPSLYWNKTGTRGEQGVLITSEPLMEYSSVLIPENTICIVDHKKYELLFRRL